ncbi:(Lyso)-N-acylphosphatidylethanolamine lipase isoform X2 [Bacillus rossius redtenbacheri]
MLRAIEKQILSSLKTAYRGFFVDIGPVVGKADKIWTVALNTDSKKTPILLLHGFASGVALWCLNLDALAAHRPVYAIDILGFGRSSRPSFSNDALEAETQLVQSVDEWRREMNLDKVILLGHSMGGFLAASYALHYPDRVKHLVLADPWGFPERPADLNTRMPLWVRGIVYVVQLSSKPLWPVRAAGPLGQWLIGKARPDLVKKFTPFLEDADDLIPKYIFHCNAQNPTGEMAFYSMMSGLGWAKNPIVNRIDTLSEDIPITLLYGSRSWVDSSASETIRALRPNSYINIQILAGAGHHVYADKCDIFNQYVVEACESDESIGKKADDTQPEKEGGDIAIVLSPQDRSSDENVPPGSGHTTVAS